MIKATLRIFLPALMITALSLSHAGAQPYNALSFDGNNDFVAVNNTLGNFAGDFTIELHVKADGDPSSFLSKSTVCANSNYFALSAISGTLYFEISDGGANQTSIFCSTVMDNNWHHVAVTRQSGAIKVYLDGVVNGTGNSNAVINNTSVLRFGANACNGASYPTYQGAMDEVRFWSRSLCQGELMQYKSKELPYTSGNGLLAYYRFNQGVAAGSNAALTTLTDATGNGNNGTLNNFALTGTTSNWVAGIPAATAAVFAGPVVVASSNSPACKGTTIQLNASTIAGAAYSWTGPVNFSSSNQNPTNFAVDAYAGIYRVTATVNGCVGMDSTNVVVAVPASTQTVGSNTPVCAGKTIQLTSSAVAGAFYTWTGPNGFSSYQQNPAIANSKTANAGTYQVTTKVNGCVSGPASVTVVVNPSATPVTVLPVSSICASANTIQLVAYGGGGDSTYTLYPENFNAATNNWTTINNTVGDDNGAPAWTLRPDGYNFNYSNDNTQFFLSDASQRSGFGQTSAILISPSFSTVGYPNLSVSFYSYFTFQNSTAKVEMSSDSITWTTLKTYNATHELIFAEVQIPSAFLGKPKVWVRFKHEGPDAYSWLIDNFSIVGRNQLPIVWSPVTGLYNDAAGLIPYTGTGRTTVYMKRPAGVYSYAASVTRGTCSVSDTVSVTIKPVTDAGYYFRTIASGNWNNPAIWEVSANNTNFFATCASPAANATAITIRSGHTVTVTANVTAPKATVQTGGSLQVGSGVVLITK